MALSIHLRCEGSGCFEVILQLTIQDYLVAARKRLPGVVSQKKSPPSAQRALQVFRLLFDGQIRMKRRVFARVADQDYEFTGIDRPVVFRLIPIAE